MKIETIQRQLYSWTDSVAEIQLREQAENYKRVVIIADMHCGHKVGLTPPKYQPSPREEKTLRDHFHNKFARIRQECWDFYAKTIDSLKPIDVLIVNADCIDGRGEKSGGTELLTADIDEQCDIAIECIRYAEAKNVIMTYGTPYHVGELEDHENKIAEAVGAKIGAHEWVSVNGVIFDVKHKVGNSIIPHGRATAALREALWSIIWKEAQMIPGANIIIRSHVHFAVDVRISGLPHTIVTPALQAMGTKYGSRQCSGLVDFGLVVFDVYDNGYYSHRIFTPPIQSQKAIATIL